MAEGLSFGGGKRLLLIGFAVVVATVFAIGLLFG